MGVLEALNRWLDLLASVAIGWRDAARARRSVVVSPKDGQVVVRAGPGGQGEVLATVSAGTRLPDDVLRRLGRTLVVFELPPDRVVGRRLTVPPQARPFLAGIVQNQIERLSPWNLNQAAYAFAPEGDAAAGGSLAVRVVIASRAAVEGARRLASEAGLVVDRIVAREGDDPALAPVPLWSRTADMGPEGLRRARAAAGLAVALLVSASLGVTLWAGASASAAGEKADALGVRVRSMQRQALGPGAAAAAAGGVPERVWAWKEGSPSTVVLLEVLSAALPETAHLTEINLQGTTLRLVGNASDAPALIGVLEGSGHLAEVRFFAPTTRSPEGSRSRFHIEAKVQPRLEVAAK